MCVCVWGGGGGGGGGGECAVVSTGGVLGGGGGGGGGANCFILRSFCMFAIMQHRCTESQG